MILVVMLGKRLVFLVERKQVFLPLSGVCLGHSFCSHGILRQGSGSIRRATLYARVKFTQGG